MNLLSHVYFGGRFAYNVKKASEQFYLDLQGQNMSAVSDRRKYEKEVIMNERILKLALDAGLLNYVDNETPRHYFVHGHADLEEVEKFAELIVRECAHMAESFHHHQYDFTGNLELHEFIKTHFGVEE